MERSKQHGKQGGKPTKYERNAPQEPLTPELQKTTQGAKQKRPADRKK